MGNRFSPAAEQHEEHGDILSLFDIVTMIVHDKIPTSMRIPACLDELIDWTEEATAMSNYLPYERVKVIGGGSERLVQFKPFLLIDKEKIAKGESAVPYSLRYRRGCFTPHNLCWLVAVVLCESTKCPCSKYM